MASFAQQQPVVTTSVTEDISITLPPLTTLAPTQLITLNGIGVQVHSVSYSVASDSVTGVTITITAGNGNNYSLINTSTNPNNTVVFLGTWNNIKISATGLTDAIPPVIVTYRGSNPAGRAAMATGYNRPLQTAIPLNVDIYGNLIPAPTSAPTSTLFGLPLRACNALITTNCAK